MDSIHGFEWIHAIPHPIDARIGIDESTDSLGETVLWPPEAARVGGVASFRAQR